MFKECTGLSACHFSKSPSLPRRRFSPASVPFFVFLRGPCRAKVRNHTQASRRLWLNVKDLGLAAQTTACKKKKGRHHGARATRASAYVAYSPGSLFPYPSTRSRKKNDAVGKKQTAFAFGPIDFQPTSNRRHMVDHSVWFGSKSRRVKEHDGWRKKGVEKNKKNGGERNETSVCRPLGFRKTKKKANKCAPRRFGRRGSCPTFVSMWRRRWGQIVDRGTTSRSARSFCFSAPTRKGRARESESAPHRPCPVSTNCRAFAKRLVSPHALVEIGSRRDDGPTRDCHLEQAADGRAGSGRHLQGRRMQGRQQWRGHAHCVAWTAHVVRLRVEPDRSP